MELTPTALAASSTTPEQDETKLYGIIFYQNSLGEDIMKVPCRTAEEYEAEKRIAWDWMAEQVCMVSVRGIPSFLAALSDAERDAAECAGGVQ